MNNRRVRTDFVKFKGDEVLLVFGMLVQDGVLLRPDDSDTIVKNLHRLTAGEGERWRAGTSAEGRGRRCGVRTAGGGGWRNNRRRFRMSHDVDGGVVGGFGRAKRRSVAADLTTVAEVNVGQRTRWHVRAELT